MNLQDRIAEMNSPIEGEKYFTLTLTANEKGKIQWATQSHFVGFTEDKPRRELRASSEVKPRYMEELWHDLGMPCVYVNNETDWAIYLLIGGNALVLKKIIELKFSVLMEPQIVAIDGISGMIEISKVPKEEKQKAPTPKNRMKILKRDDFRCQICGRRAADYIDVELHVHHVRPWSLGGLTKENNLITLCHTCHKGLAPHNEFKLWELVPGCMELPNYEKMSKEFTEGVKRYRQITSKILSQKSEQAH